MFLGMTYLGWDWLKEEGEEVMETEMAQTQEKGPERPSETELGIIADDGANDETNDDLNLEKAKVKRVVDGDTIELEGGQKLRYIGIDTPETVHPNKEVGCMGYDASARNKELVEGREVWLEKDVSETDRYGRLLRYVYFENENGEKINVGEILMSEGLATVSTYQPDVKYVDLWRELERQAREAGVGLWAEENCPGR